MKMNRIVTLLGKEFLHGPRGFILVMTIVAPLLITLIFNVALGSFFSGKAQLAIYDEGQSQLVTLLDEASQISIKEVDSPQALRDTVSRGAADVGIIIPSDFESSISGGERVAVTTYIWGESLSKDRTIINTTLLELTYRMSSQTEPISLESVILGDEKAIPWSQRLLPLMVLTGIFLGGLMLPATLLIEEKLQRTLQALAVTPASLGEIFIVKGIVGVVLSLAMGIIIILINNAWGTSPLLLVAMLFLGAVMASQFGLILGALIKDMNTLFSIWKFGGLILFAPAIIYMFPQVPQWLSYLFPTYYVTGPIMDLSLGTTDMETLLQLIVAAVILLILALIQVRLIRGVSGKAA